MLCICTLNPAGGIIVPCECVVDNYGKVFLLFFLMLMVRGLLSVLLWLCMSVSMVCYCRRSEWIVAVTGLFFFSSGMFMRSFPSDFCYLR